MAETDEVVKQHQSMLDHERETARYLLDETVERALTLRSPFGPGEWADYAEEWEAELVCPAHHGPTLHGSTHYGPTHYGSTHHGPTLHGPTHHGSTHYRGDLVGPPRA